MKKVFVFITILILTSVSCSKIKTKYKYGEGGSNAEQFVLEQVPGLKDNIANIEVIETDSLLGDVGLIYCRSCLAHSKIDFQEGKISKDQFSHIIDSLAGVATDIEYSWRFSISINDSLKTIPKYNGLWRKVYKVCVTMKSSTTMEPRVLMDSDGTTPRMLESDMEEKISDFTKDLLSAQELLWTW